VKGKFFLFYQVVCGDVMINTSPEIESEDPEISSYVENLHEIFENMKFFAPSRELTKDIVTRLAILDNRKNYVSDDEETLFLQRRFLGEQIYLYLATLSKTPEAINDEPINIEGGFNSWFGKSIGLSTEETDNKLRLRIAEEFYDWIEGKNSFTTGWGKIDWVPDSCITLKRFDIEESEEGTAKEDEKVSFSYPVKEREKRIAAASFAAAKAKADSA
jgi:hypothetical protein